MILGKKFVYYSNLRILSQLVFAWARIAFVSFSQGSHKVLNIFPSVRFPHLSYSRDKITRYVTVLFFFVRHCGGAVTCFNYSQLLCYMLRWAGFDAKINFGARKSSFEDGESSLTGHCWVSVGSESIIDKHQILCSYP